MLSKLSSVFGFSTSAVNLIRCYLSDRFQCVCIDGHFSELAGISAGIPQGSVLGPLLFSMYINDLPSCLRSTSHHMFADDVQLMYSGPKSAVNEAVFRVNQDLYAVSRWARQNSLKLNAKKSQAIVFEDSKLLTPGLLPPVILGGIVVPYADKVLNLGLVMDKKLTFKDQVSDVCSKVFARLRSLWPNSHVFSRKVRSMLVKSLVLPAFTYCDSVYSTNLSAADVRALEGAFSACVRFVFRLRRYDSTRDYLDELLGCPIMTYLKRRRCSFLHGLVLSREPGFLFDRLVSGRSVRSRQFVVPRHSSAQYGRSFFVRTVADYNAIPTSVRLINSQSRFADACQDHFMSR